MESLPTRVMRSFDLVSCMNLKPAACADLRAMAVYHADLLTKDDAKLSTTEYVRVGKLIDADKQSNLSRSLRATRMVLSDWLAIAPEAVPLERAPMGSPLLIGYHNLKLSLSRTSDWTAIALAPDRPIGVDIEQIRDIDWEKMLLMICDEIEGNTLRDTMRERNAPFPFFRAWTAKEAILKATGRGFAYGAKKVVIPQNFICGEIQSASVVIEGKTYDISCFHQQDMICTLGVATA